MDVLINIKYYAQLKQVNTLSNESDWQFYVNTATNMKFYFRKSSAAGVYAWKWPFIGINFYTDKGTHITSGNAFDKSLIFPLVLRPIGSLWLPAPRNIEKFLQVRAKYHYSSLSINEECYLQRYSHKEERVKYLKTQVKCAKLHNVYPYVRRHCDQRFCNESLMLNDDTMLYTLRVNKD